MIHELAHQQYCRCRSLRSHGCMQMGSRAASNSFWQHLTGDVTSCEWLLLHDGAGGRPSTAEALPFKTNIQIGLGCQEATASAFRARPSA